MKNTAAILFLFFISAALCAAGPSLYAKSLWKDGLNVYKLTVKKGDLVRIRFSEKTIMKYKIEQKQNNYQVTKGKKGGGQLFSFFPDAEVNENDTIKNQNDVSVNNENKFVIPAKVTGVDGVIVSIEGLNSSLINGETFKIKFLGEFDMGSLNSDYSVFSTDIYDLDFQVTKEPPASTEVLNEKDLLFATNYSELTTNSVVSNNITNIVVTTNQSSVKLELKGIQDAKKKQLLVNYLNFIVNSLFH